MNRATKQTTLSYNPMSFRIVFLLLAMTSYVNFGLGAKILIPGPLMRGRGHTTLLSAVSAELTSRGHHVTILVPTDDQLKVRQKFDNSQATEILEYPTIPFEVCDIVKEMRAGNKPIPGVSNTLTILQDVHREQVSYCRQLLNNTSVMKKLREMNYDLIIEDMGNGCDVLLPEVLKVPFIALTSNTELIFMNYNMYGIPIESSYVISPFIKGGQDRHLAFGVRIKNILMRRVMKLVAINLSSLFIPLQEEFHISPEKSMSELASKAQFWLSQDSYLLEDPHPTMPNYSPIGGMAAARPGQLPLDFQEFVDGSGDAGFIVFSTGSIVASGFDDTFVESIALVLKKLPQRVFWKHSGSTPKNLGSNTKIAPWLPQAALIAHPKARLILGHGGLNGIYEALYHGVPMVLVPQMLGDQTYNAFKVERYGYGVHLDKADYSPETFESKIIQILSDSSYTERVCRCSEILQDDDPMDRAVYWVEHILKFGGSHLRAEVFDLNFVQYYLLDVFAFFLFVLTVFVLMIYIIVLSCCLLCKRIMKRSKLEKMD
ncbi:LOW QUALITY PROTEIN: UDP-glucuronosyltransferase 2A3-like [Amphiura filiformis]|uniref:LOW QUALITY PROTEIN: UDP-glucuronosyltransferase 2A3-like n=1 Tax=Amphiura filiformis TaxID=82378 RepID=UPI003B21D098